MFAGGTPALLHLTPGFGSFIKMHPWISTRVLRNEVGETEAGEERLPGGGFGDINPSSFPGPVRKRISRGDAEAQSESKMEFSASLRDRNDIWRRLHEFFAQKNRKTRDSGAERNHSFFSVLLSAISLFLEQEIRASFVARLSMAALCTSLTAARKTRAVSLRGAKRRSNLLAPLCHCERSEAISDRGVRGIASLRSQ
jgi:hypothetical protein